MAAETLAEVQMLLAGRRPPRQEEVVVDKKKEAEDKVQPFHHPNRLADMDWLA